MGATRDWRESELAMLGTMSDADLAKRLGCTRKHIAEKRADYDVPPFSLKNQPKKIRRKK